MQWLRNAVLTSAAFGSSWGASIFYWRETNRVPAVSELVLYLLVLPLLLLGMWWLARKAWTRVTAPATASPATGAGAGAPGAVAAGTDAAAAAPAAPLPPALTIAASAVRVPHGDSVSALRTAVAGNRARPSLDKELSDDDGYPILSARLEHIDDAVLRDHLLQWLHARQLDDPRFDQGQWRALAAASAVASELAAQASVHIGLAPWLEQQQERRQGRLPPDSVAVPAPPSLRLLALWPDEWQPQQRELAQQWLHHVADGAGWPAALLAPATAPLAHNDAEAGVVLNELLQRCADIHHPCLAIVIAAGSHLTEAHISHLSSQNALYTAKQPQGRIPGEGAAGLLLADAATAGHIGGGSTLQALHQGRRLTSADEVRRDTDTSLADAVNHALQAAQVNGAAITLVAADTGHRTSRVTELMHVVTAAAPQLDPGVDVISAGASCGSCGAVGWLTALALGDAEAQDRNAPVLCISNEDPYHRYAALLRPAPAA
jgi:hypothetical protein